MIRLVEQAGELKGDESIKPSVRMSDKRLSTMSIDKKVVESANCRRFCPALVINVSGLCLETVV
jgi:hypothetical protein